MNGDVAIRGIEREALQKQECELDLLSQKYKSKNETRTNANEKTKHKLAKMQTPYIPTKDADFDAWLTNFSVLIAGDPTDYGLVAGDATIITAAKTAFHAAYLLAINPATRTSPNIAEKDNQRASATATVRPYAIQISLSDAVSDALKLGVGVNVPNPGRTPVPAPFTAPTLSHVSSIPGQVIMGYADSDTPASKRKPFGVIAMELRRTIGIAATANPAAALFVGLKSKSPVVDTFDAGDVGKIVTYFGRWVTRSGPGGASQYGPWSTALSFAVV